MNDFKNPPRILRSEDQTASLRRTPMTQEEIRIDEEEVHAQVDKITQTMYFQYIQSETKKLRDRVQNYELGFAAQKTGLKREFGAVDVFVMTCCTLIGLAIAVRTITIQTLVPGIESLVPVAFLVAAIPAVLVALCYAVFASSIPRSGGDYVFISRGFHPFLGFWSSWTKWFGMTTALGFIAYTTALLFSDFLRVLLMSFQPSPITNMALTLVILTVCFAVNFSGAQVFKWATRGSFVIFIAGGLLTIVVGLAVSQWQFLQAVQPRLGVQTASFLVETGQRLSTGNPFDLRVLLGAAAILFFAYWGLETAIAVSGEVRNPERAIPRGIVAAIAFTTLYYFLYSVSVYHMVPWEFVAGYVSNEPNSSVLALYGFVLPPYAILFVSFALVISVLSDIFPLMLSASRIVFAWSFDGLIPKAFTKLNSHGVPSLALVLSYAVSFGSALECNYSGYLRVLDLATLGMLWTYILVALTILTASVERPLMLKNAKFRLGRFTRPVAVVAFLTCLVLFGEFILESRDSFFFFTIWSALGAAVYYWIQQRKLSEKIDMQATFALIPPE